MSSNAPRSDALIPLRVWSLKTTPKPKVSSGALRSHTVISDDGSSCRTRLEKYRPAGPPPTTAIRMCRLDSPGLPRRDNASN